MLYGSGRLWISAYGQWAAFLLLAGRHAPHAAPPLDPRVSSHLSGAETSPSVFLSCPRWHRLRGNALREHRERSAIILHATSASAVLGRPKPAAARLVRR